MITTSDQPPDFRNSFLQDCAEAFRRRGKTLRYRGTLEFVHPVHESREWLTAAWSHLNQTEITLKLVEDRSMHLYIESTRRRDQGKVLLRIEHMKATSDGEGIVSAFKETDHSEYDPEVLEQVRSLWRSVSVSLHPN